MLTRRGATLAELLVALALAGLVLGTAGRSVLHQQRASRQMAGAASADAQSRAASELLRSQLSLVAPRVGDLSGEPSDTSVQLRAPVALGAVCASAAGTAIVSVDDAEESPVGATLSPPRAGDSLWWYAGGGRPWAGRRLSQVWMGEDDCPPLHTVATASLRVQLSGTDTLPLAAPVRLTRQYRYDFYRSGDGRWHLGSRDWSDVTDRFVAPQPIAGPFVRRASSGELTGFRFFDGNDSELGPGEAVLNAGAIARIRLTLLVRDAAAPPFTDGARREQLEIAVQGSGPR